MLEPETFEPLDKVGDVSKALNCTPWQVYELIRQNRIPGIVRLGPRTLRAIPRVYKQWIAEGCPPVDTKATEAAHG